MTDHAPSPASTAVPAGWYGDPLNAGHARWWSGEDWTHHVHEVPRPAPVEEEWTPVNLIVPRYKTLAVRSLVWGIVAAVLPITVFSGILAIVYGAVSLQHGSTLMRQGQLRPPRGMAIAGIVLGGIGLLTLIVLIALLAVFARR